MRIIKCFFILFILCIVICSCDENTNIHPESTGTDKQNGYVYTTRYNSFNGINDLTYADYLQSSVNSSGSGHYFSSFANDTLQLFYIKDNSEEYYNEYWGRYMVNTDYENGTVSVDLQTGEIQYEDLFAHVTEEQEKEYALYAVKMSSAAGNVAGETAVLESQFWNLYYLNADGSLRYVKDISQAMGLDESDMPSTDDDSILTDDGSYVHLHDNRIYLFASDGTLRSSSDIPGMEKSGIVSLCQTHDGNIAVTYQTSNDMGVKICYTILDVATGQFGEEYVLPITDPEAYRSYNMLYDENTVFHNDNTSLFRYEYSPATTEWTSEKLFDWTDFDIIGAEIDALYVRDEQNFAIVSHDPLTDFPEVVYLDYVPADSVVPKTDVVIACGSYQGRYIKELQRAVTMFNRSSDVYQASIRFYDPKKESAFSLNQQIGTDMIQGEQVDLILFHRDITMEYFDNLGILGDWYPYMDADADYTRDTFLPCVLDAYETSDGTLPVLTTDFGLTTLIGATENLDAMERWSYSECSDYVKALDWDQILLQLDKEKDEKQSDAMLVFQSFLPMVLDDYIDENTGTCTFDSDSFKQLLTLCTEVMINHEAAALKYANGAEEIAYQGMGYLNEYRNGKTLLFNQNENLFNGANSIMHPSDMMNVLINFFDTYGGDITCIGYPMPDGVTDHGTAVTPWMQFGLIADAKHADGAWAFVKGYLSYQQYRPQTESNVPALPCTRAALDALYEAYLTYVYVAAGSPWLQEYADGINHGETSPLYHDADPRACDLLDDLLAKTTRRYSGNTAIMNILYEEAVYFFDGIQPIEEVTKRMQSRVGIYLSEHQ